MRLYVVIGGTHETGVIVVLDNEAEANEVAADLSGGGYVEAVTLNEPTDFGKSEFSL